jgi:hypothetical protein
MEARHEAFTADYSSGGRGLPWQPLSHAYTVAETTNKLMVESWLGLPVHETLNQKIY